jgi:hypothetical protein
VDGRDKPDHEGHDSPSPVSSIRVGRPKAGRNSQ